MEGSGIQQENRINFPSAQQLNDSILAISGRVLGFSIAFLRRADDFESSILLKVAWVLLGACVLLNVFARVVSLDPSGDDKIAVLCWRFLASLSAGAFISGLGLLTAFSVMNV